MARSRTSDGDRTRHPSGDGGPPSEAHRPGYGDVSGDDALAALTGGRPFGGGSTVTTSSQSMVEVARWTVDSDQLVEVDEVAVAPASNGAVEVRLSGVSYGEFAGAVDVTLPFDGAVLDPGDSVVIRHRSTDGVETETLYQITGRKYE